MGKRFAIVIGVAAAGVMALGAQTATSSTGEAVDSTPPDLQLSGKKKQSVGDAVIVKVSCGDEACNVFARGVLTNVKVIYRDAPPTPAPLTAASADLGPGETTTLKLKLKPGRRTRKKVRNAVDEGKKGKAEVKVKATDAAGNVATAKRTIRLVA